MTGQPKRSGGKRPGAGGKPGVSGGTRPGAGRKPTRYTLKQGDVLTAFGASEFGSVATVDVISRNVMYLRLANGIEIKLVR